MQSIQREILHSLFLKELNAFTERLASTITWICNKYMQKSEMLGICPVEIDVKYVLSSLLCDV